MKKAIQFTFKLTFISIIFFIITCKKDELAKVTKLEIGSASSVTDSKAMVGAEFIDVSGKVTAYGHCWATSSNPEVTDSKLNNSGTVKKGDYSSNLIGLSSNTKYYVRAFAMEGDKAIYSTGEISFTTLEAKYIDITAPTGTDNWKKGSTETIGWTDNIGENVIIELYKGGTLLEDIEASTESDGSYNWTLRDGLTSETDYSIKISSVDNASIFAQSEVFEISETPNIFITVPTTGTDWQKGSSQTITWTDNLDENVKIELFQADTKHSDIALNTESDGTESWIIPGTLEANNNYKIKISSVDYESIFSESENFTVSDLPAITISAPTSSSSWQMGTIQNITWTDNISENVKIELFKGGAYNSDINVSTLSDGNFEWTIPTNLMDGDDYKIRITSTSNAGITDESEAFEIYNYYIPVLSTTDISNVSGNGASSGGNITDDGGQAVTARGVCWATTENPTISNSKTTDGSGTGVYTSSIAGLSIGTSYYVMAYATNSVGTAYGTQKQFTTHSLPSVTTNAITSITHESATSGGNVTDDGGAAITARGVCWSTSENPTITDNHTTNGTGIGSFTSNLTSLTAENTYYVRAYATNSIDTAYGNQQNFTTEEAPYITVTSPTSADHWIGDLIYQITWNDNISENILIKLYKNGVFNRDIISYPGTANNGSFSWTIPNDLTYAKDFSIRIVSAENNVVFGESTLFIISEANGSTGSVSDSDGNTYSTIKIDKQWWMAENLKTTRLNDYTTIPSELNVSNWLALTTAAYCYLDATYLSNYGRLYNWYAVNTGKLCPISWHVSSEAEWTELSDYLGGDVVSGGKLKHTSTLWLDPNSGATNESGFSALPGGYLVDIKGYGNIRQSAFFWTSTGSGTNANYIKLEYNLSSIIRSNFVKYGGLSIRCVRD